MNLIPKLRREMKYYINEKEYVLLRSRLKHFMKKDEFNPAGTAYLIRSLYFDTLDNKHFYEKQGGVETRQKLRLRVYPPECKIIKFELKHKFNNHILKEAATISKEDVLKVQKGDYECLLNYKNPVLDKIYRILKEELYLPVALVEYSREAYTYPINNTRITFDRFISTDKTRLDLFNPSLTKVKIMDPHSVVMEVKYSGFLPRFIRDAIQITSFIKTSISKYYIGRIIDG